MNEGIDLSGSTKYIGEGGDAILFQGDKSLRMRAEQSKLFSSERSSDKSYERSFEEKSYDGSSIEDDYSSSGEDCYCQKHRAGQKQYSKT